MQTYDQLVLENKTQNIVSLFDYYETNHFNEYWIQNSKIYYA